MKVFLEFLEEWHLVHTTERANLIPLQISLIIRDSCRLLNFTEDLLTIHNFVQVFLVLQ